VGRGVGDAMAVLSSLFLVSAHEYRCMRSSRAVIRCFITLCRVWGFQYIVSLTLPLLQTYHVHRSLDHTVCQDVCFLPKKDLPPIQKSFTSFPILHPSLHKSSRSHSTPCSSTSFPVILETEKRRQKTRLMHPFMLVSCRVLMQLVQLV